MKFKDNVFQISCDGGAATGKTTGARMIAKKYNLKFLSSGLLYRYASFLIIKYQPKNKISFLNKKFNNLIYSKLNKINLHTLEISKLSSIIAKEKKIRKILKKYQQKFSKKYKNCCIEGRDISTKILPSSNVKFYFKCSLHIAAKRRYKELKSKNKKIKFLEVKKALRLRNISDIKREHSPLLKHRNSIEIDTGKLDKAGMLVKMSKYVDEALKKNEKRIRNN